MLLHLIAKKHICTHVDAYPALYTSTLALYPSAAGAFSTVAQDRSLALYLSTIPQHCACTWWLYSALQPSRQ